MKFILNKDKLKVEDKEKYNSGSVNYYEADVEHDQSWDDLIIEARLIKDNDYTGVSISVIGNKVGLDKDLSGKYFIGFVGYTVEDEEKVFQISSNLQQINFKKGAGELQVSNGGSTPVLTEWERYIAQLQGFINDAQDIVDEADTLDIDVDKEGSTATITLTKKDGTTKEVQILDGQKGEKGDKGDQGLQGIQGEKGEKGDQGIQGIQGERGLQGIQGEKGDKGADGKDGVNGTNGVDGKDGQDGFSPVAAVTSTSSGATISITDKNGTTTANVTNGINGTNGTNGQDGYTPIRGTDYWTASDIASIEQYCADYIDENITQAIGGSY